jgi:negative regulator of sigma E activity
VKISEETLMAYADGELAGAEREAVEQALASDPDARALLEEHRRLRSRLTGHYGPVAQEEVPGRLLALLGAEKPEGVVSLSAARKNKRAAPALWQRYGAIAASLAVGIVAGQLISAGGEGPIAAQSNTLVAQGSLATALETQLASAQQANSATRIGLTFQNRQGRVCRTFDASALSGLACKSDGDWQVLLAVAAKRQDSEFRQAGSPAVFEAAQAMMGGPPLNAEGERKAMAAGWKISAAAD